MRRAGFGGKKTKGRINGGLRHPKPSARVVCVAIFVRKKLITFNATTQGNASEV